LLQRWQHSPVPQPGKEFQETGLKLYLAAVKSLVFDPKTGLLEQ
jgi:hypothetical protein